MQKMLWDKNAYKKRTRNFVSFLSPFLSLSAPFSLSALHKIGNMFNHFLRQLKIDFLT